MNKYLNNTKILISLIIIFYCFFIGLKLYQENFNFSKLILVGDKFSERSLLPHNIAIINNSAGFDGQFYYRLALNPFTASESDFGITFDEASLRQQRITYPLLVWFLSLGQKEIVPAMMLIVNFGMIIGIIFLAKELAEKELADKDSKFVLLIALSPVILISLTRGLTEITALFFLLAGYLTYRRNSFFLSSLLFVIAVMARETALVVPCAITLLSAWDYLQTKNKDELKKIFLFSWPLIIFIFWQIILSQAWGDAPFIKSSGAHLALPFSGLIKSLSNYEGVRGALNILSLLYLIGLFLLAALNLKKTHSRILIISWLGYALIATSYKQGIWLDDLNFFRSLGELTLLSFLIIASGKISSHKRLALVATIIMFLLMALKLFLIGHVNSGLIFS